ncbi:MAG: hypothetical protein SGARI_001945 [Bacillariaceae sp.]
MLATTKIKLLPKRPLLSGAKRYQHSFSSATSAAIGDSDDDVELPPYLLRFSNARLQYPSTHDATVTTTQQQPFDFPIYPPDLKSAPKQGGYAVLGRNGSGKSLLGAALRATVDSVDLSQSGGDDKDTSSNPYVASGALHIPSTSRWHSRAVAHVSFDSHRELLQEKDDKTKDHITAFKAIATAGGAPGKLNPAAQFLVVRFGLYPLLHRTVNTLSTGEIRKVLLIRALSQRPKLLVLDNAFDGLDVPSRDILKELVSKTIKGFTNDILVQGVNSKATARTQIVLMTHRAEEIVDEIDTVARWEHDNEDDLAAFQLMKRYVDANDETSALVPSSRVLHQALGMESPADKSHSGLPQYDWHDPSLPSVGDVSTWWSHRNNNNTAKSTEDNDVVVKANKLSIRRGDTTLLHSLDWTVHKGERWIVGGGNGAGKSSISRLLANPQHLQGDEASSLQILPNLPGSSSSVGWVSTESHLKQHQEGSAKEILLQETYVIAPVLSWLEIPTTDQAGSLLNTPFHGLSQGQQKMILLTAAIAKRPPLLVLDEPCQGLDLLNRQRLLQVVERICAATDMSLVYITHHLDEEQIPSITHAMHVKDRKAVFQGGIADYDPAIYSAS